jgi:hypothetical protein
MTLTTTDRLRGKAGEGSPEQPGAPPHTPHTHPASRSIEPVRSVCRPDAGASWLSPVLGPPSAARTSLLRGSDIVACALVPRLAG